MFRQARQNRTFEDVIGQIQEAILEGRLKTGDRLPAERKLREVFGVSRGTLREALRALEQKRLITVKTGVAGGAVVASMDTGPVSESLDLLLRYRKVSLEELAEFREGVEALVAGKVATKARKEEVRELTRYVESIRVHLDAPVPDWDAVMAEDKKFHLALGRMAGNRVFESVLYTVYENIQTCLDRFLPKEAGVLETLLQDLSRIAEAVGRKDSRRAASLVRSHVRRFAFLATGTGDAKKPMPRRVAGVSTAGADGLGGAVSTGKRAKGGRAR